MCRVCSLWCSVQSACTEFPTSLVPSPDMLATDCQHTPSSAAVVLQWDISQTTSASKSCLNPLSLGRALGNCEGGAR